MRDMQLRRGIVSFERNFVLRQSAWAEFFAISCPKKRKTWVYWLCCFFRTRDAVRVSTAEETGCHWRGRTVRFGIIRRLSKAWSWWSERCGPRAGEDRCRDRLA